MKKLSLILFFIFIACSTTQEIESTQEYKVADDFIPTSEIVWCKANYKTFQNLVKILEDDGEYAFNKEMNKLTTDQVEEVQDKFKSYGWIKEICR